MERTVLNTGQGTEGMARIPGGKFRFAAKGIEIEGSGAPGDPRDVSINPYGVDFQ